MRLLDRVAHTRFRDAVPTKAGRLAFNEPQALQRKLAEAPIRYVLADDVAAFCLRMMAEEPDFLLATRDLVRAPAPLLWFEWNDTLCRQMLGELGIIPTIREDARFTRAGCLVESDEGGRRGRLTSFWATHDEDTTVEVSPFCIEFDFDDPDNRLSARAANDEVGLFLESAGALNTLMGHARLRLLTPWGEWMRLTHPGAHLSNLFKPIFTEISCDFQFLWAFLIALGAQNAVTTHAIDHERLNRARSKRGRPELLAHLEVRSLFGKAINQLESAAVGGARGSPRLHFVRGHLVRRGDIVFWRSAHMRGTPQSGAIKNRTVHLALGRRRSSIL